MNSRRHDPARYWRNSLANRHGNITILFALLSIPMVLAIGASADLIHVYAAKGQLAAAVDAATLATATNANGATNGQMTTVAASYLDANFSAANGITVSAPTVTTNGASQITVSASATIPTNFLKMVGLSTVTVNASSTATMQPLGPTEVALVINDTGTIAGIKDTLKPALGQFVIQLFGGVTSNNSTMNVALIPFMSAVNPVPVYMPQGSTTPAAFATMLTQSNGLANTAQQDWPNNYPYSAPTADYTQSASNDTTKWLGCVEESASMKYLVMQNSATAAQMAKVLEASITFSNGAFSPYYWAAETGQDYQQCIFVAGDPAVDVPGTNSSGGLPVGSCNTYDPTTFAGVSPLRWPVSNHNYFGPNRSCPQPLTPLTNNLAPLLTAIGVNSDGSLKTIPSDTTGDHQAGIGSYYDSGIFNYEGLAWADRVLTPASDGGLYASVSAIGEWSKTQKYVVLFADGDNSWDEFYSAQGNYPWPGFDSNGRDVKPNDYLETVQRAVCDVLKSKGVTIFSIENSANNTNHASYYCAGKTVGQADPNYYYQPQQESDILPALQSIASKISQARISN